MRVAIAAIVALCGCASTQRSSSDDRSPPVDPAAALDAIRDAARNQGDQAATQLLARLDSQVREKADYHEFVGLATDLVGVNCRRAAVASLDIAIGRVPDGMPDAQKIRVLRSRVAARTHTDIAGNSDAMGAETDAFLQWMNSQVDVDQLRHPVIRLAEDDD